MGPIRMPMMWISLFWVNWRSESTSSLGRETVLHLELVNHQVGFYTYFPFIAVFCLLHRLYIKERRSDLHSNTPSTLFVLLNPIIITIINFLYSNNLVTQTHQSQINESRVSTNNDWPPYFPYQRQSHGPFEHFTKIKFYCTLFEYFYSAVLWL